MKLTLLVSEVVCLLAWLSHSFIASSASQTTVYIPPEHRNCSGDGKVLTPCYSFQQLIHEKVLPPPSEGGSSVALFLLPGAHLIPGNEALNVSGFDQVTMSALNTEHEVLISCQNHAKTEHGHIVLNDNDQVGMLSLHFISCVVKFRYDIEVGYERSVNLTNCIFESSQGNYAISVWTTESRVKKVNVLNCTYSSNAGAIVVQTTQGNPYIVTDLIIANTLFQSNDNAQCGGALNIARTNLFINNSYFISNSAKCGGSISADSSSLKIVSTIFHENGAFNDGSVFYVIGYSTINLDKCHFTNNSAGQSATIFALNTALQVYNNSIFQGNTAGEKGGVLYMENSGVNIIHCQFLNNSAQEGGVLYSIHNAYDSRINSSVFLFNEAETDGGAIYCKEDSSVYIHLDDGYSSSNSAGRAGGFAYSSNCLVVVFSHNISWNSAQVGGAVYAERESDVAISNSTISQNTAGNSGAGLYLSTTHVSIKRSVFDHNAAANKGGAIFVEDNNCERVSYPSKCFLDIGQEGVVFSNNTAGEGSTLYGGLLDRCCSNYYISCRTLGIDYFKSHCLYDTTPLALTSDPVQICLCNKNLEPNCSLRTLAVSKMRGQTIDLKGIVVDQDDYPKASHALAQYSGFIAELGEGESRRRTDSKCTKLSYHVFTAKSSVSLILRPEGTCERSNFSSVTVTINLVPCSRGFERNRDRCACDRRLVSFFKDVACDISNESIQIKAPMSRPWFHYGEQFLRVHFNCPLDYCQVFHNTVRVKSQDEQCANNHSGVICGACQSKYSIGLGSSKCLECASSYAFAWLVPTFAVAGIALVALLLICNITISHGTLNGLIFYANVISIARLTRFQGCSVNPVLSVFIAWINLDFGIETCFYAGMDAYHQTWLQFAFPLYIWLLVGAIILVSHFSLRAVKVFGKNNIALLATLLLLSYTKILKIIITALSFTQVFRGSVNDTTAPLTPYKVWTHDGNIKYLKGKHVPLFAVALVLLMLLFLPYTLLLTFGQCVRSVQRPRRFVVRFIRSVAFVSIMDAHHAPYANRHRYWTGLMLLVRCVLFLSFASSYNDNRLLMNTYATALVLMLVLGLRCCISRVYKSIGMNILEISFLLNLGILSATLLYLRGNNSSDSVLCKCSSVSISISMAASAGILVYHIYLKVKDTNCFKPFRKFALKHIRPGHAYNRTIPADENLPPDQKMEFPTKTTVELREELLDVDMDED